MVFGGSLVFGLILLFFVRNKFHIQKLALWGVIFSAFLTLLVIEAGWITTEVGRQPYVIYGYMKTNDAFTTAHNVISFAVLFPILYLLLLVVSIFALIKFYKKFPLITKENAADSIPD